MRWFSSDAGQVAKIDAPAGYANVRAHAMFHREYLLKQQRQAQQGAAIPPRAAVIDRRIGWVKFKVFRMKNLQARYLLEVILLVEREDVIDSVVFHDYAVYHVSHAGVKSQYPVANVIEELREVVFRVGTYFEEMQTKVSEAFNAETPFYVTHVVRVHFL